VSTFLDSFKNVIFSGKWDVLCVRRGVTYCAAMVETEGSARFLGALWGPDAIVKPSQVGCIVSARTLFLVRFHPSRQRRLSILFRCKEEAEFFRRLCDYKTSLFYIEPCKIANIPF
jgi:hypothetical protein